MLNQINEIQKKDDLFFLSSCYNWDEKITKKENWIEPKYVNAEKTNTLSILKQYLKNYELISTEEIFCVERKSERKFELKNCEFSVWKKIE